MKVLVTGGCGFVGSHIVDSLVAIGHDVTIFDNLSSGKKERVSCKVIVGDIRNPEDLEKAFSKIKPDVVVHTAAQVMLRRSIDDPIFDTQNNIIGTINLLEACKKHHVKKVIYTATGGACYGEPDQLPVNEDAEKMPLSPYGISKYAAEHYVRFYATLYGFDYLILRFGNVYGPRDDPASKRVIAIFIDSLLNNKDFAIFGDGDQTRDFLYVKDIAQIVSQWIDQKTKNKIYNLASGEGIKVNQVYEVVAKECGVVKKPRHVDAIAGEIRFIFLDISKAKKELEFIPTSFEQGIKETVEWFKKEQIKAKEGNARK